MIFEIQTVQMNLVLIFSFSFNNKLLNKIVTGVLFTGEICYNQLNIINGSKRNKDPLTSF